MSLPRAVCGVVLTAFLVGCTTQQPTVSASSKSSAPTPSPSPTCSPYDSTPRPCTPEEYARNREQNELIAHAQASYRKYWAEDERLQRAGGTRTATPALLETLTGDGLKQAMAVYRDLKANGTRAEGGSFEILSITPKPTRTKAGSAMSLTVCWRTKNVKFRLGGEVITRNATVREDSYLRKVDDVLKIFTFESQKVSTC